jgi:hypothetical protein
VAAAAASKAVVERAQGITAVVRGTVETPVVGATVVEAMAEALEGSTEGAAEAEEEMEAEAWVMEAAGYRVRRCLRTTCRGTRRRQHQCTARQTRRPGTRSAP